MPMLQRWYLPEEVAAYWKLPSESPHSTDFASRFAFEWRITHTDRTADAAGSYSWAQLSVVVSQNACRTNAVVPRDRSADPLSAAWITLWAPSVSVCNQFLNMDKWQSLGNGQSDIPTLKERINLHLSDKWQVVTENCSRQLGSTASYRAVTISICQA